jgi:hypothetical protein
MSRATVEDILQRIDALPRADRERLENALAARAEEEWRRATKLARAQARRRKITQSTIDRALDSVRYGRR